jgi:hypothetical protein
MTAGVALSACFVAVALAGCVAPASSPSQPADETQVEEALVARSFTMKPVAMKPLAVKELRATSSVEEWTASPPACEEPGRYVVRGDVVIDTANGGRIWQRAVDPTLRSQGDAAQYCASVTIDGLDGWRLPDVHELQSLRLRPSGLSGGPQYCMPSIDQSAFPETPADEFWSATTRPAGDGLYTGFDDGRTHPSDPATPMHARCVHDAILLN